MSELVFKDPPHRDQTTMRWKGLAAELKDHPDKWVLVGRYSHTTAANGRNRLQVYGCEATVRRIDKKDSDLYARWPEQNGNGS